MLCVQTVMVQRKFNEMLQSTIIILSLFISHSLQYWTIHVTPEQESGGTSSINQTSFTVEELLKRASHYLVSNTTVLFHPGLHQIRQPLRAILIQTVEYLTLEGMFPVGAVIHCRNSFSLTFINVTHLSVANLHLVNCGSDFSLESIIKIANTINLCDRGLHLWLPPCSGEHRMIIGSSVLAVVRGMYVSMSNVRITGSEDVGLLLLNIHFNLELSQLELEDNGINCIIATTPPFKSTDNWQANTYTIKNLAFRRGNSSKQFASGLNLLFKDFLGNLIINNIQNIIAENNKKRNILLTFEKRLRSDFSTCHSKLYMRISGLKVYQDQDLECLSGILIHTTAPLLPIPLNLAYTKQLYACAVLHIKEANVKNAGIQIAFDKTSLYETIVAFSKLLLQSTVLQRCHASLSLVIINTQAILSNLTVVGSYRLRFFQCNLTVTGSTFIKGINLILLQYSTVIFESKLIIIEGINSDREQFGAIMHLIDSNVEFAGFVDFRNNSAQRSSSLVGRGNSEILITGIVSFINNIGYNGGAIALYQGSKLIIYSNSDEAALIITNNYAQNYGGAIYIQDYIITERIQGYRGIIQCAILVHKYPNALYLFKNNAAKIAGENVYGGWFDYCKNTKSGYIGKLSFHTRNSTCTSTACTQREVTSSAIRVCLCENNYTNCYRTDIFVELSPGEKLQINAVAVGQRFGVTPATVRAVTESGIMVNDLELLQNVQQQCTPLVYTIYMVNTEYQELQLLKRMTLDISMKFFSTNKQTDSLLLQPLTFTINIKDCRKGYIYRSSTGVCECDITLTINGLQCNLQKGTVERKRRKWVHPTTIHLRPEQYSTSNSGVLVHHFCPLNYCNQELLYIDLNTPNEQCQFNRSGILCGKCAQNLSGVFGSSKCMECSNYWAFLIVPVILLAGVLLVLLLSLLNLTVSIGTINGLIFYANIIRANQSVFFSSETNSVLSWFIAWLNLDLGFEVCFYNDMDTYTKTWLQFVFPLYVWFLVALMITCSHYSTTASRLTANNAVQVLATLFLLSYTKLLRITIVSLSFTTLQYPDGYTERVWLYDGSIPYMRGKHLVLFIAALAVLVLLSVPYTLLLFSIQWLQRYTHYRTLRWVTRFKPIFDAYTGPYKSRHRYWTGLLLLVRVLLFLVFSLNVLGDPTINLLAIVTTILCILTYSAYVGGVYRKWPLDLLENTFHLNLGICSLATLYTYATDGDHTQLVLASTGLAFTVLAFIILYHTYLRLSNSALCLNIKKSMPQRKKETDSEDMSDSPELKTITSAPTTSVVELEEPLLD